jgi:hypothetical protein
MFKKTAAAYGLAQEFLQRGDSRNARLAMDIGDRFENLVKLAATLPNRRISPQGLKAREAEAMIKAAQTIDGPPENTVLLLDILDIISKLK